MSCTHCGKCQVNDKDPDTVVVVTLRIIPDKEEWSPRAAEEITNGLKSFAQDWCEVNNREADVNAKWAIYEGAEE